MRFAELAPAIQGKTLQVYKDRLVESLLTDSRKPVVGETSVFFAIRGERHDGHRYISELYATGLTG